MTPYEYNPVEFGRLQEQVAGLQDAVQKLDNSVQKLTDALSESRGGWKVLVTLGTVAVAVSSGVAWIFAKLKLGV